MIGQSQAGTGKTAAFALTMLSRINLSLKKTQAICIVPARELAVQILQNVKDIGQYTSVTTQMAIKDHIPKGKSVVEQIVVGTPGTLMDLMKRKLLDVSEVKIFVLDEADSMLDQQGMGDQSLRIKKYSKLT